jgi:hypothetical protein
MNENKNEEDKDEEGKKPKRWKFISIKKYKTEAKGDFFIRSSHPRSTMKIKCNNHLTMCTMDQCRNQDQHKMRFKQFFFC